MLSARSALLSGLASMSTLSALPLLLAIGMQDAWAAMPDVLDRPAIMSRKAGSAVLLSVARNGDRLLAAGERGIILISDNHGASWRQASVPVSVSLTNLRFASRQTGWAVGHGGIVLRTADGGEQWEKVLDGKQAAQQLLEQAKAGGNTRSIVGAQRMVADGADKPFLDVLPLPERGAIVVGAYGLIMRTDDSGKTWTSLANRIDDAAGRHLYSIQRSGDGAIVIAGEQGALYRSDDDGKHFSSVVTPYAGTYFQVLSIERQGLFLGGLRGNAYVSDDGGKSWNKSVIPTGGSITAAILLKDGSLLVADEAGRLFRSANRGRRFAPVPLEQASPASGLADTSDGGLVLSGARGVTKVTADSLRRH